MANLQVGRFERLGARSYSIKGPGALVDLDETVLGVINLERQGGPESWFIQGWEEFGKIIRKGASGAATYSWNLLSNPVGSGRLMVVDGWQRDVATLLRTYLTGGIPPAFVLDPPAVGLDTRIPNAKQPAGDIYTLHSNIASFGTQIAASTTLAFEENQPIVLAPDGSLVWRSNVHNEDLDVTVRWAERDAQPFEL